MHPQCTDTPPPAGPTAPAAPPEAWLTVAQAATALGLAVPTVYRQIAHGRLVTTQVAGQYRINPAEIARYQRDHLGRFGWGTRRTPAYVPSRDATYTRRSRARRRAVGAALSPMDVAQRLAGRPNDATVAGVVDALRSDPAWTVHELVLPGRVTVIEMSHHPSNRTYILRRRQGRVLWRLGPEEGC